MLRIGDKDFDNHEIAIITGIGFGMRDGRGEPMLWFSPVTPGTGSLQCLVGDDIKTFLTKDYAGQDIWVTNIKELEGKPVIIVRDGSWAHVVGLWLPK